MTDAPEETREAAWHAEPAAAALDRLGSGRDGLSPAEAMRRLEAHGPNALPAAQPPSALRRFLAQFHNVLIYVLLAAAVVTALLGEAVDTALIGLVVLANAIIGFVQEGRAEQALNAIRAMVSPNASVVRDGRRVTVDAVGLVPGDLLPLAPPFRELHRRYPVEHLAEAFVEGIVTGHPDMPEFQLAPEEADDLIAYLRTLE